MPMASPPSSTDRQRVYFSLDRGVSDPRVAADKSMLYGALKHNLESRVGYSSAAAGWSEDIVAERWALPPTEVMQQTMRQHRFVVYLGRSPTFVRWDDDDSVGEDLARAGTIHLLPQGLTSQTCWTSDLNVLSLEFSATFVGRLLDGRDSDGPSEQLISCRNVPDMTAYDWARRIIEELARPTERLYGEMLCLALAVHVRQAYGRKGVGAARFKGRLSAVQARRALDYIHANLESGLTVSALARETGLSPAHFARAFRATFDEPPHRLVLRWRLERAARLVGLDGLSLAEASVAAGFCDQAHFSNAVRRHFDKSPAALIRDGISGPRRL